MFTTISFIRSAFTGFLVVLGIALFAGGSANAQSVCKGLSKTKCESNDKCSHVKAHKRKDGASVDAFCRAKPGNGSKKKTVKKKASDTKKSTAKKASDTKKSTAKKATDAKKSTAKKADAKKTTAKKAKAKKADAKKTAKKPKKPAKKPKKKAKSS